MKGDEAMAKIPWRPFRGKIKPHVKERRYVLLQVAGDDSLGMPPSVAVGYLRVWSNGPWWVIPGFGRDFIVTHYADCLGDDFQAPLWKGTQK